MRVEFVNHLKNSASVLTDKLLVLVNKSVVFLDEGFVEILHWHGGATFLFNCGVLAVKEFSSFEKGEEGERKGVFLISTLLTEKVTAILKDILEFSNFKSIVVITNISSPMHTLYELHSNNVDDNDDTIIFRIFQSRIRGWFINEQSELEDVDIIYLPLVSISVLPSLFVLPSHKNLFPLTYADINCLRIFHKPDSNNGRIIPELDFANMPKDLQLQLKLLCSSINSLMELLCISEDVFSIGCTSSMAASELASLTWSKNRRKSGPNKASLLLVDRSLDLSSICSQNKSSFLDKIYSTLSKLDGHSNDVAIDMHPLFPAHKKDYGDSVIFSGCLSQLDNKQSTTMLDSMAFHKQKDILMMINKLLLNVATKEKLIATDKEDNLSLIDKARYFVQLFSENSEVIYKNSGLLQYLLAILQVIDSTSPVTSPFKYFQKIEQELLMTFCEENLKNNARVNSKYNTDNPFVLLMQFFEKEEIFKLEFCLESFLTLLLYIYTLDDDRFDWSNLSSNQKTRLELLLAKMIKNASLTEISQFAKLFKNIEIQKSGEEENRTLLMSKEILNKLSGFAMLRRDLLKYSRLVEPGSISSLAEIKPFLERLLSDIFKPDKPELNDITYKSSGYGDFLKSGFGFFRTPIKPRPGDHPLLIIFVLGGISISEVKQVKDQLASIQSQTQVIIGSTSIVNQVDILRMALFQDNLNLQ